ncbi:MAG: SAP domain-containing protein [Candidatus Thermoplasmatota archaeon]|nr:SAP domain-containing protein [Euryarchaeota archaeon]MBU4031413.1 SAP domain-containing protein [Candidatus Thermoplasmatota archaeon]MBU4144070.1 SAP domain-containing protein [Candidatus Thermoplasmatota archaeon]MBU4592240.1 SAP domain-containing protein [Candidatus Thermoplasmatota archaeon]
MGDDVQLKKLKSAELKTLAREIGLSLTGKEKKNELVELIVSHVENRLVSLSLDEIKALAANLNTRISEQSQHPDYVAAIMANLSLMSIKTVFGLSSAVTEDNSSVNAELEQIGSELVGVEKDLENVVRTLENVPSPDMADIYLIDQKLSDVVKMNIEYSKVASMLDVGRIKFLDRKYIESMNMLTEAVKASEDMLAQYKDITQAFIILSAEKILEECRESKSNNEFAADALISAKRNFFDSGKARAESVKRLTETSQKVYKEEIMFLEGRLASVEPLISALKVQGVDVFNSERYLHRAREAFLAGELVSVNSYIEKSINTAEESKNHWIQEIRNDIPRVESILKQASELGADISVAEKHLGQAKVAFDNQDYSLCSELKKIAERKAMESQHLQIQKAAKLEREKLGDAEKILAVITPLVREAEAYSISTQDIYGIIQAARNALVNNDYVNALTYARDAETLSKPIWTQIKAYRESIVATGEPLQQCNTCNSMGIKVFPNNKAVCISCGMVYDIQVKAPDQKKAGWFKKK